VPLVTRWTTAQRDALDAAMRAGIAIVAADDCRGMRLLPRCRASGHYGYRGTVLQQRVVSLSTDEELRVNAPLAEEPAATDAARPPARFELAFVGRRGTTRGLLSPEELTGECSGATHFIEFAEVGSSAGALAACAKGHAGDAAPPQGCASPLSIRILPIAPLGDLVSFRQVSDDTVANIGTCPPDMVVSNHRCTRLPVDAPYLCAFGDAVECQSQCDRGDVNSCDVLGFMRRYGKGVPKDTAGAAKLYVLGCDHADAIACASLGEMTYNGDGVPKDRSKALALFERACNLGDLAACGNLGAAQARGDGVAADEARGRASLTAACDAGGASACLQLHDRLRSADRGDAGGGDARDGGGSDDARARALLEDLCGVNFGEACHEIARGFMLGEGVVADHARAAPLFEKACRTGFDEGCVMLGLMYRQADGVQKDDVRATRLMDLACSHGYAQGCFNLGIAYENGKGIAADPARAVKLYEQACASKIARACFFWADCVAGGVGTKKDAGRASELYAQACTLGEKEACGRP